MTVGKIRIDIVGDAKGFKSAANDANKSMGKMETSLGGLGKKVAGAFAAGAVLNFAKSAIGAASSLAETQSQVGVIFGDSAKKVREFGATAATALGQSEQQALAASSTFATFGKSAGLAGDDLVKFSTDFTKLATDLASFKDTSPEDAIVAIGAALRGESEPIRNYGVLLDDATLRQEALALGIIQTTKQALTPQQKVLAAQAAIYKQTSDAQGDFERTSGGVAGQTKIMSAKFKDLQAELGEKLLPVVVALIPVVEDLGKVAGDLAGPLGLVAKAVAFAAEGLGGYQESMEASNREMGVATEAEKELKKAFDEQTWSVYAAENALGHYATQIFAAAAGQERAAAATKAMGFGTADLSVNMRNLHRVAVDLKVPIEDVAAANRDVANQAYAADLATRRFTDALNLLNDTVLAQANSQLALESAIDRGEDALAAFNDAVKKGDPEAISDANRDLEQSYLAIAEAAGDNAVTALGAAATEAEKAAAKNGAMRKALTMMAGTLEPGGEAYQAVMGWIALLGRVPMSMTTKIGATFTGGLGRVIGAKNGGQYQSFHDGGVVAGPRGSEQPALLKAGETVLPTHKPGAAASLVQYNTITVVSNDGQAVVEAIKRYERAAGTGWRS